MKLGMHIFQMTLIYIHLPIHHSFKCSEHLLCARHILVFEEIIMNKTHKDLALRSLYLILLRFPCSSLSLTKQTVFLYIILFLLYSLYIAILIVLI